MYDCMQVKNIYTSQPLEPFKGLLSEMGWVNYPSYLLGLKEKRKNEEWGMGYFYRRYFSWEGEGILLQNYKTF